MSMAKHVELLQNQFEGGIYLTVKRPYHLSVRKLAVTQQF